MTSKHGGTDERPNSMVMLCYLTRNIVNVFAKMRTQREQANRGRAVARFHLASLPPCAAMLRSSLWHMPQSRASCRQ